MFGWLSAEADLASNSNRFTRARSLERPPCSTFRATSPPKPGVRRTVDPAHAARSELGNDLVRSEPRPGRERHSLTTGTPSPSRSPPRIGEKPRPPTRAEGDHH